MTNLIYFLVVPLVVLLMLLDYYLTLYGRYLAERSGHSRIFVYEQYELNPDWQRDIAQMRRFNPRHLIRVLIIALAFGVLAWLALLEPLIGLVFETLAGFIILIYAVVLGRHVNNILLFRYIERHTELISGEVRVKQLLLVRMSQFQLVTVLFPLLAVVIVSPSFFGIGALLGLARMMFLFMGWSRKPLQTKPKTEAVR